MNLRKIYILFLIIPLWCSAQTKNTSIIKTVYCDTSLITLDIKHIKLLDSLIEKAQNSQSKAKIEFERQFFCAMSNSYESMLDLLYTDEENSRKKYQETDNLPPIYNGIHRFISYYSKLESIEPNQYYNKYINMCVDGFYLKPV